MQFCRYSVKRAEVNSAVPVARPHPHSRFVMASDDQSVAQIEAELFGAGLMPLSVQVSPDNATNYVVDVADNLSPETLQDLEGVAVQLQGDIRYYFRMQFWVTLVEDAAPWALYQALFDVGIAPLSVNASVDGTYTIVTSTSIYSIMLNTLAANTNVASVSRIEPVVETEQLLESDYPFTYVLDVNLDMNATDVNNETTPQSLAQTIVNSWANGRASQVLCTSTDGRAANCQVRTSFELSAGDLRSTVVNTPHVDRFVVDEITSLQSDIELAAERWICKSADCPFKFV